MKQYFKSLFPWRWLAVLITITLTQFFIVIGHTVAPFKGSILIVILNIPFWFVVDYYFGIAQESLWDRRKWQGKGYWNYRIMAKLQSNGQYELNIHEVHYNKEGIPDSYTARPVGPRGDKVSDIRFVLNKMIHALDKPILYDGNKFPEIFKPKR